MYSSQYYESLLKNCRALKSLIELTKEEIELEEWAIKTLPGELNFLYKSKMSRLGFLYYHQEQLKKWLKEDSRWLA